MYTKSTWNTLLCSPSAPKRTVSVKELLVVLGGRFVGGWRCCSCFSGGTIAYALSMRCVCVCWWRVEGTVDRQHAMQNKHIEHRNPHTHIRVYVCICIHVLIRFVNVSVEYIGTWQSTDREREKTVCQLVSLRVLLVGELIRATLMPTSHIRTSLCVFVCVL